MISWTLVALVGIAVLGAALVLARLTLSYYAANPQPPPTLLLGATIPKTLIRAEPLVIAAIAPLILFSSPLTVAALAVIPLLWLLRWKTRGYFLPRTPLDWPIVLMAVMLPVSLLVTFDIGFSLGKVALLVYGIALYYAAVDWVNTEQRLNQSVVLYFVAGFLLALLGLLGTDWQNKLTFLGDLTANLPHIAQGLSRDQTGFHPNIVAGALLWVVLPLLAVTAATWSRRAPSTASRRLRLFLLFSLLLTTGTLVLTQSRVGMASALAGVALLFYLAFPRLRVWLLSLLALLAVVIVALAILFPSRLADLGSEPADAGSGTLTNNLTVRLQVWQSALHAIADYPLTGMGVDTFRRLMPVRYPAAIVPDSYDIGHAHNQLLQAAVDLGLPGLVGYLALWIAAAALAWSSYRAATNPWNRALAAGVGAALLASFLHGLADAVALVSKPGIFFWALLALDTALYVQVHRATNPVPRLTTPSRTL
jgi:O-antigen ligase